MPQDANEFQPARSLQGRGGTSCWDVFEQMIRSKHRQVQSPLTERRQGGQGPQGGPGTREDQGGAKGPPPRGRGQVNRTRPTAPLHINHRQGNLTQSLCWAVDYPTLERVLKRSGASVSSKRDHRGLSSAPHTKSQVLNTKVIVITSSRLGGRKLRELA